MKKKLDAATIVNELRGQSAFFPTKSPQPVPEQSEEPKEEHRQDLPQLQPEITSSTPVPPYPVPSPSTHTPYGVPHPVPPLKRRMKQRQPFDVYEDQYETLKTIADDERAQGLPGSMSRMVREGIDMYLAARKKGEK
jgi:hypothetical protein